MKETIPDFLPGRENIRGKTKTKNISETRKKTEARDPENLISKETVPLTEPLTGHSKCIWP